MAIIQTVEEAVKNIKNEMSVMIGGFLGVGAPLKMIEQICQDNIKNLTVISVAGSYPGGGFDIGKLSTNKQIKRFISSHIGTDPELIKQYNSGEIEVEFNPIGTWIERIRAGGAGLGAVVTPVGLGTEIEEGCQKIIVKEKEYLVYAPLKADIAIIKAFRADKLGNLQYRGTSLSSNPVMATAADLVIAEVDEIVDIGEIDYNHVGTPSIFVDIIVKGDTIQQRKQIFEDLWVKSSRL